MRADPGAARRDIAQQRIQRRSGFALMQRIDPDQDAIGPQQLRTHFVGEVLIINRWLGVNAQRGQRLENLMETVVLRRSRYAAPHGRRARAPPPGRFRGVPSSSLPAIAQKRQASS